METKFKNDTFPHLKKNTRAVGAPRGRCRRRARAWPSRRGDARGSSLAGSFGGFLTEFSTEGESHRPSGGNGGETIPPNETLFFVSVRFVSAQDIYIYIGRRDLKNKLDIDTRN